MSDANYTLFLYVLYRMTPSERLARLQRFLVENKDDFDLNQMRAISKSYQFDASRSLAHIAMNTGDKPFTEMLLSYGVDFHHSLIQGRRSYFEDDAKKRIEILFGIVSKLSTEYCDKAPFDTIVLNYLIPAKGGWREDEDGVFLWFDTDE
jgi:hypothetical protein